MGEKRTNLTYGINIAGLPPQDKGRRKGEIDTEPFIPKSESQSKKHIKRKSAKLNDLRSKFYEYCNTFPIDYFQIPRPMRSQLYRCSDITDSNCALMALTLLGVPHDVEITVELEPVGWLEGPHLLKVWLDQDWSLAFGGQRLIDTLKINPWLIVTDSVVQLALGILRIRCEQGTPRESKLAKQILEEIGLELLIPERIKKKKRWAENITLDFYSKNPDWLIASVRLYEFVIRKHWKPPYKRNESQKKKGHCGEAFRLIFKKDMPPNLIEGDKNSSPANVALAFIGYETHARYTSLHKIFYPKLKDVSDSEIYRNFDLITDNKGDKLSFIAEFKKQYTGT